MPVVLAGASSTPHSIGIASKPTSPVLQGSCVLAAAVDVCAAGVDDEVELDELLPQPASSTAPASTAISERVLIGPKGSWC